MVGMSIKSDKKDDKDVELLAEAKLILAEAMIEAENRKRPFYCI